MRNGSYIPERWNQNVAESLGIISTVRGLSIEAVFPCPACPLEAVKAAEVSERPDIHHQELHYDASMGWRLRRFHKGPDNGYHGRFPFPLAIAIANSHAALPLGDAAKISVES